MYGFLGPNGSGKSTTMKMLLGLTQPTSGDIRLFGRPLTRASRTKLLPSIGSMIEAPPGYAHLSGRENLRIVQDMLGLSTEQIDHALATVRLTQHQHKLVRTYSLGMKQRLGIAMALARDPALLILDEPTNGLDPAGIEEIRTLLVRLAGEGITVMVSSHLLDEIDKMASVLAILSQGRMIFQGTRDRLFEHSVPDLVIETPPTRGRRWPRG
ncbi:ABC transporter ATP-binding protein [Nonomuraea salmonea]|uniref:ABC transporter ATP-binding protein n=1 Tax=Nonomuraea salmonea TaxID=46181 RepID=UPI002FEA3240